MKVFTMIARHGVSKDEIGAYSLISQDYQVVTIKSDELIKAIKSNSVSVTNLTVGPKGIESTNGAIDKYTLTDKFNNIIGTPRAVILDRVENNDKLVGYTVFTQHGTVVEMNPRDAAALANKGLISNGKVRHTAEGDVVSAIKGNYPLRTVELANAPKGEVTIELMCFCKVYGVDREYFGAIISDTSATEMSRIADLLNKSNAKVISSVTKVAGKDARESLAIRRVGANGMYGMFDIDDLERLMKLNTKVVSKFGEVIVSSMKYLDESDIEESTAKIGKGWKVSNGKNEGTDTVKQLKTFTKSIVDRFSDLEIE